MSDYTRVWMVKHLPIKVEGENKWITLIQNASKSEHVLV